MTTRYCEISRSELEPFLFAQGFSLLDIPGTFEYVYRKVVNHAGFEISLRVLSSISVHTDKTRPKDSDSIKVMMYVRHNGDVVPVGKPQRCLRTKNWRKHLQAAQYGRRGSVDPR